MSHFIYCYAECQHAECHYAECRNAIMRIRALLSIFLFLKLFSFLWKSMEGKVEDKVKMNVFASGPIVSLVG